MVLLEMQANDSSKCGSAGRKVDCLFLIAIGERSMGEKQETHDFVEAGWRLEESDRR